MAFDFQGSVKEAADDQHLLSDIITVPLKVSVLLSTGSKINICFYKRFFETTVLCGFTPARFANHPIVGACKQRGQMGRFLLLV